MDVPALMEIVLAKAGLAAALLLCGNLLLIKLYLMERKDRQEAWKAHIELAKETNKILSELHTVLEVIKVRIE
jgi:argininosuccinate lyase